MSRSTPGTTSTTPRDTWPSCARSSRTSRARPVARHPADACGPGDPEAGRDRRRLRELVVGLVLRRRGLTSERRDLLHRVHERARLGRRGVRQARQGAGRRLSRRLRRRLRRGRRNLGEANGANDADGRDRAERDGRQPGRGRGAIAKSKPVVVLLAAGSGRDGRDRRQVGGGPLEGQFIGSVPTWTRPSSRARPRRPSEALYHYVSPWGPYGSDRPAHTAMEKRPAASRPPTTATRSAGSGPTRPRRYSSRPSRTATSPGRRPRGRRPGDGRLRGRAAVRKYAGDPARRRPRGDHREARQRGPRSGPRS